MNDFCCSKIQRFNTIDTKAHHMTILRHINEPPVLTMYLPKIYLNISLPVFHLLAGASSDHLSRDVPTHFVCTFCLFCLTYVFSPCSHL